MSVIRAFCTVIPKRIFMKKDVFKNGLVPQLQKLNLNQERNFRKSYGVVLRVYKTRRKIAGPEKLRKRSDFYDFDYDKELYAFGKRLSEDISSDLLRRVFIHDSYIQMEEQKRKDLNVPHLSLNLKSNADLVVSGQEIISKFLKRYLRHCYRVMPEDGICAVHDYLLSDDILSHVSYNIGTSELTLSAEYPPEKHTLAATLKAFIGLIACDNKTERAENFVLDFICPQLIGKDIFEIWEFDKPLNILNGILQKKGCTPSEPRLVFESGRNTIEAIYHVGLYSNEQFLGRGVGETLPFAEEMAAYDALRRIFCLNEAEKPLPFGKAAKKMEFKLESKHCTIRELCSEFTHS